MRIMKGIKKMEVQLSQRLKSLPPYLFADLRRKIALARENGVKVIRIDIGDPEVRNFIDSMVSEHAYDRGTLENVLQQATTQESILEAIARPAERTKEWHEYRDIFLTLESIHHV